MRFAAFALLGFSSALIALPVPLPSRPAFGDKDVELPAGQLTMEIGKSEDYRAHVDASALTADLEASAFEVSKGGSFRSFDKSGPGKYGLHAHLGAGEIDLR